HDALEMRPGLGVEVDGERDLRVGAEVQHLPAVAAGGEIDLAVGHHLAHGHEVRHPARARRGHPADPLPANEIGHRFLQAHPPPSVVRATARLNPLGGNAKLPRIPTYRIADHRSGASASARTRSVPWPSESPSKAPPRRTSKCSPRAASST